MADLPTVIEPAAAKAEQAVAELEIAPGHADPFRAERHPGQGEGDDEPAHRPAAQPDRQERLLIAQEFADRRYCAGSPADQPHRQEEEQEDAAARLDPDLLPAQPLLHPKARRLHLLIASGHGNASNRGGQSAPTIRLRSIQECRFDDASALGRGITLHCGGIAVTAA
jgi:hypothetical protein